VTNPFASDATVYIDDAGLIWDATLNQTVSASNANKFYRVQLLVGKNQQYITWTRWGRVGEHGQSARLGSGGLEEAIRHFEAKFKNKSGLKWEDRLATPKNGKYTFLERNYEEDDEDEEDEKDVKKENGAKQENGVKVESGLSKPVQSLMKFIFNNNHVLEALAAMSYDAKKMPLGKLSKRTLTNGFLALKELSELIAAPASANAKYGLPYINAIESLSDRYYTLIPHVFGRNRPPTLGSNEQIKKEVELLEALTDMDVTNEIMKDNQGADEIHELDRQFKSLGMEEMVEREYQTTSPMWAKLIATSEPRVNRVQRA
jgi:poly [ADP-ribose] polymerase